MSVLCWTILFGLVSCGKDEGSATGMAAKMGSAEEIQPSEEIPLPSAREIERGGEEYDYSGWVLEGPDPDLYVMLDERWERIEDRHSADYRERVWTDPENGEAEIAWGMVFDLMDAPKDAIWGKYGEIIEKGGDVKHGRFVSKYFYDAYYCRYVADGYVNIQIDFWFYPDEPWKTYYGGEEIQSLLYKNLENVSEGTTIDEASFWKMAQSVYVARSYTDMGPEPYIPAEAEEVAIREDRLSRFYYDYGGGYSESNTPYFISVSPDENNGLSATVWVYDAATDSRVKYEASLTEERYLELEGLIEKYHLRDWDKFDDYDGDEYEIIHGDFGFTLDIDWLYFNHKDIYARGVGYEWPYKFAEVDQAIRAFFQPLVDGTF